MVRDSDSHPLAIGSRWQVAGRLPGDGTLEGVNDLLSVLRRIAVTFVGAVILALGVVLLVAPGPGLLVIALALVVFAVEYEWARRHLATVQARARSAAYRAAASRAATAAALLFGAVRGG